MILLWCDRSTCEEHLKESAPGPAVRGRQDLIELGRPRRRCRLSSWRIRGRSACWPWHLLRADGGAPLGLREVLSSEASPGYLAGGVILGACWRARAMLVIAVSAIAAMPISAAVV